MDENVKYVLKKDYVTGHGTLHANSEIRFFRGAVYFDGGMVPSGYAEELYNMIKNPKIKDEYFKEVKLIKDIIA